MQVNLHATCGQCKAAPVANRAGHISTSLVGPFPTLTRRACQHSQLPAAQLHHSTRRVHTAASSNNSVEEDALEYEEDENREALEAKMEEFLRQQALLESGESFVAPAAAATERVLGTNAVTEEEAKQLCKNVRDRIKLLKSNRDMAFNEIKLTIMIEDPRARERRQNLGIEDESGVSRDELAAALVEVAEGRIPKDRLALKELDREMSEWPYADLSNDSRLSQLSEAGTADEPKTLRPKKLLGRDKNEAPEGIQDLLPDWVGYGALYAVSAAPIVIGVGVITILFLNSLK